MKRSKFLLAAVYGALALGAMGALHGFDRGLEIPAAGSAGVCAAGLVLAAAILHLLGPGLGLALRRRSVLARLCGGTIVVTGHGADGRPVNTSCPSGA